jgi:hypothetical protein
MNSTHIISQDVFDKIRSRFQNLEMGDDSGGVTTDPKEARFFDFDFVVEGKNLGRVSISINERGSLKIFYSQGILENTDDFVHQLWYDFLREMRMFAKRRLLRFDTRDITKSNLNKNDFQYLAANGPKEDPMNMNESAKFEGGKKTSYRVLEKTKLIAKHKKSIENEAHGARSRSSNIKALYVENSDGERFKYPFIHIAGAKAMQRHVANGGKPYDDKGNAIIKMSEEIIQLSSFRRHVGKPDGMNQKVNEITSKTDMKLESLRRTIEGLCNQNYYEKWGESFVPNQSSAELDETTLEDYKSTFTVSSFREDLAQYFPLIHKIMHETGEINLEEFVSESASKCTCDEESSDTGCPVHGAEDAKKESVFSQFENWADRVIEGKLEADTIMALKDLLDDGLTLDVDGRSAIDALEGIGIYDEELESALEQLAKVNPQADPKDTILGWLAKSDLEAAQELGYKSEQPDADVEPEIGQDPEEPADAGEKMPTEDMGGMTPSVKEVAEMVYSFFDRETGKFPKGKKGVEVHVGKELGEQAGALAKQLVDHLQPDDYMGEEGPDMDKIPAYVRKEKQRSQDTAQTATDARNKNANAKVWKSPRVQEEFESIMKLAGLAK